MTDNTRLSGMDSKKIYSGLAIVFISSVAATYIFKAYPPIIIEVLAGVPAIGALFGALFQLGRDSIAYQRATQLETYKALLERTSKIHERQVDALLAIHYKLDKSLFYLQRAASAGKLQGEPPDEELLNRMALNLGDASEDFAKSRLLVSESLAKKLDEFFNKMLSGGITLNYAISPMVQDGNQRAPWWDEARDVAYKQIPALLSAIRDEAKIVIHG